MDRHPRILHSLCLPVSKDLLDLPFSLLLSLCTPLFSGNVGNNSPTSKSMPVCTCSLLSWLFPQVSLESLNPRSSFRSAWMCVLQRKKQNIPGKEGRELHTSITCALEASPSVMRLPNLCLPAPLLLTTPSAFQLAMSDVSLFISPFPQTFRGASSSCTSPTPPSLSCKRAISPHTWEPYGRRAWVMEPLLKAALSARTPVYLCPWFFWAALNRWLSHTAV